MNVFIEYLNLPWKAESLLIFSLY